MIPLGLRRRRARVMASAMLGLAVVAASCSDPVAPPAPTPVEATITEAFSGTLLVAGSNVHAFNVSEVGRVRVTLTSLTPGVTVILSVGTLSGAVCAPAAVQGSTVAAQASETPQLSGTATITGTYCVSVSATPAMTEPAEYSLTVAHS
jgi:hypothetical protein